ncbi:MAG: flagellar basal body rod C-terminal domain-containing protein, partial [Pseudomonadota bacterium]
QGYVQMPNVDAVESMVDMMSASRAYQANADLILTEQKMLSKALTLGQ